MIHVHEPLSTWEIVVTELSVPEDARDPRRMFNIQRFKTIQELRDYLFTPGAYAVAQSLRYGVPKPRPEQYAPGLIGRLTLTFTDRFTSHQLEFNTAADLARFLAQQPVLAAAVGFTRK